MVGAEGDVVFVPAPAFGVAVRAAPGRHPALLVGVVVVLFGEQAGVAAAWAVRPPFPGRDVDVLGAAGVARIDRLGRGMLIGFVRFGRFPPT